MPRCTGTLPNPMRASALRLLPLIAAGAIAAPASASAATLTISAPKTVNQWSNVVISWQGDTTGETADNRIVRIVATKKACPSSLPSSLPKGVDGLSSENIFHIGGFAGAEQMFFTKSGKFRLCGYLSPAGDPSGAYAPIGTSRKITVKKHRIGRLGKAPTPKSATYTATGKDIIGGTGATTVTFTIADKQVTSASLSGIPNTACRTDWPTAVTPISGTATSTGPKYPTIGAPVIGDGFTIGLASDAGTIDLVGQSGGSKRIYGSVTLTSPDGSCRGGVGFVAKKA